MGEPEIFMGLLRHEPGIYSNLEKMYHHLRKYFELWNGKLHKPVNFRDSHLLYKAMMEARRIVKDVPEHERTEGYIKRWILWLPDEVKGYGMYWLHQITDVQEPGIGHTHSWPFISVVLSGEQEELFTWKSDDFPNKDKRIKRRIQVGEMICRTADHTHVLDPVGDENERPLSLVYTGERERAWQFVWDGGRSDGNDTLRKLGVKHNAPGVEDW